MKSFTLAKKPETHPFPSFSLPADARTWRALPVAVTSLMSRPLVQPKLTIGAPNDKYEQEADRVADAAMHMSESEIPSQNTGVPIVPDQSDSAKYIQRPAANRDPSLEDSVVTEGEGNEAEQEHTLRSPSRKSDREGISRGLLDSSQGRVELDSKVRSREAAAIQTKLEINEPGDEYEQEADRMSEQVMRMEVRDLTHTAPPAIQRPGIGSREELAVKPVQRLCPECEEETLHRKAAPTVAGVDRGQALQQAEAEVNAVSGGQPLTNEQRAFFEPRFGVDFSSVRIHTDGSADTAARAVGALAYTRGSDIVFRRDHYHPHTCAGRQLLAHELTHNVQQGAAPRIQQLSVNENGERPARSSVLHMGMANHVVQRWPGDGMGRPGDCGWARYLILRGSVETAKAVVSTLGACSAGDSCLFLATKIAAITAEIAARVAVATTCFRGGDTGHRGQVQEKINMMNRCYRFFSNSNCSPKLIAAMAVVVERAREVIAAAAVVVAIALAVALIAAIIALAEVIAAAVAAAAEAAAVAAAAAAVIALLVLVKGKLSPKDSSSA